MCMRSSARLQAQDLPLYARDVSSAANTFTFWPESLLYSNEHKEGRVQFCAVRTAELQVVHFIA
jgi:hypothetical protein